MQQQHTKKTKNTAQQPAASSEERKITKTMDPTAEFEIDTMVLDYMCSKAIFETVTKRAEELAGRPPIEESNILTLFDSTHTPNIFLPLLQSRF